MPLAQPLTQFRQKLEAQIREDLLFDALNDLLAALPEGAENHQIVSAFIARINAANKERRFDTISIEEHSRLVSKVRVDLFELIGALTEADFSPVVASAKAGKAGKSGSVLYRVPNVMPIQKPTRCTIRVAVDEGVILDNLVFDEHVEIKSSVEISDVMSAELVDPVGGTFQINALNRHTQLVKDTGYTEWNFNVTPLREGVHQLLVKVSIMEIVPGYPEPIPREVSVMETVTIVTDLSALPAEALAKAGADFKPSGQSFAFQSSSITESNSETTDKPDTGATASPQPASPQSTSPQSPNHQSTSPRSPNRSLRSLALFLAFIILAPAATWAFTPKLDRELFFATLQTQVSGSTAALDNFIQENQQDPAARPYLDKAYFRKAEKTDSLSDLRVYQQAFGTDGQFRTAVLQKIETHETNALKSIQTEPNALKIRQFVTKFPESERLPEVKQAVEARAETRAELMAELENAYVASVQVKPTETKVAAYLRDFPKQERLNEVAQAAATEPVVLAKSRPALEEAIARKMEAAKTTAEIREVLPALESVGSGAAATKIENIVEKKSPQIKKQVQQQVRQSGERVRLRERRAGASSGQPENQAPESSSPTEKSPRHSGLEMIPVKGGAYTMGDDTDKADDNCEHQVKVGPFSIGKYEVTQADWREVMGEEETLRNHYNCDECPADNVSWNDVRDFLKKLNAKYPGKNYRLPTEAEWEYAARGGNKSQGYLYSGSNDLRKVAWYSSNSSSDPHRVGDLAPNELGIFDMSGNVAEWCQDTWGPYPCDKKSGTTVDKLRRVFRGGSWYDDAVNCRAAFRYWQHSLDRLTLFGFRLARD